MYIVIAILMFGVLIAIHEFGHFATAKACRVRVDEFSIGMGPAIFKKQKGETQYSLRILPIGGYCAMGEDEESDDPRAFPNQNFWKRLAILCAGSFMNFLLGIVLIVIMYSGAEAFRAPIIDDFLDGCAYNSADAFQAGDEFYSIDGNRIYLISDVSMFLERGNGVYDADKAYGNAPCDSYIVPGGNAERGVYSRYIRKHERIIAEFKLEIVSHRGRDKYDGSRQKRSP